MRKLYQFILTLCLLFFIQSCQSTKKIMATPEAVKAEALAFSLEIVETYFTLDCEKYYEMVSDSIYIMDGDGIVATLGKKTRMCRSLSRAILDKSKTMEDYKEIYTSKMLTMTELKQQFEKWEQPTYYNPLPQDYFFIGFEVKVSKQHIPDFIWDDMFVFMVRKVGDKWMLKGVSG